MVNKVEKMISGMSLKEKVGQMVIIRAYDYREKILAMLSNGEIGGIGAIVITQKGTRSLEKVIELINHYKRASKFPLLLYMDAECGIRDMFDFGTIFPSLMALGATFSGELAYKMGYVIGKEARAMGMTMASNPVLDINNNPDNPIINTRAISDNTDLVIQLAGEYIKGIQEAGIIPNGKHFPGHGDTNTDSHVSMPVISHDKDFLMSRELKPYAELIKKGMIGVMTAHILYPSLLGEGEDNIPATLSRHIITDLLRHELGFKGLIVSDSLAMKGIKNVYGIERSAVLAVKAGHDIILQDYGSDPEITLNAVISAIESGEIEIEQVNDSVRRILTIRESLRNLDNTELDPSAVRQAVGSQEHIAVAREIADRSVTVLENRNLPFRVKAGEKILVIATKSEEEGSTAEDLHSNITGKAQYLLDECKKYQAGIDFTVINENPDESEANELLERAKDYDHVIFATFVRIISYKEGSGSIPDAQAGVIGMLNEMAENPAFIVFGSPYALRKLPQLKNCIVTYCDCEYSIDASLKILFGRMRPQGRLPVTVNEKYTYGYGL